MRFIFEGHAFRTEQVSLLRPARRDAADVVDNAVTGEMTVVFCVRKARAPPDAHFSAARSCTQAARRSRPSRRGSPRRQKSTCRAKVIIQSGSAHIWSPFYRHTLLYYRQRRSFSLCGAAIDPGYAGCGQVAAYNIKRKSQNCRKQAVLKMCQPHPIQIPNPTSVPSPIRPSTSTISHFAIFRLQNVRKK